MHCFEFSVPRAPAGGAIGAQCQISKSVTVEAVRRLCDRGTALCAGTGVSLNPVSRARVQSLLHPREGGEPTRR